MLRKHFLAGTLLLALPLAAAESSFLYQDFIINELSPPAFQAAARVIAQLPELSVMEYTQAAQHAHFSTTQEETRSLHDRLLEIFQPFGEVESLLPPAKIERVFVFKFVPAGYSAVVLKIPNPYFVGQKERKGCGGPNYSLHRNVERVGRAALLRRLGGSARVTAPLKELALRSGASATGALNDATTIVVTSFIRFAAQNGGRAFSDNLSDDDVEKIVSCITLSGIYGLHAGSIIQGEDGKIYFIDLECTHAQTLSDNVFKSLKRLITGGVRDRGIGRALVRYLFQHETLTGEKKLAILRKFCRPGRTSLTDPVRKAAFLQKAPGVLTKLLQRLFDEQLISRDLITALKLADPSPWIVAGCEGVI